MEAPPVIHPQPRRSAWWLITPLPVVAMIAVLFYFNPSHYGFYPRCLLYRTTGILCPGCGSLRALHQLSHGHLVAALHCNLLLVISLPFFGWLALRHTRAWLVGARPPRTSLDARWITVLGFVVVLFTILRNIPGAPFDWLAPV